MEYITEICIAVLALAGSALGSFSGFKLTAYRVEQLEKKVENHSSITRRIPVLEEQLHNMGKRLERLEHRVEVLENRLDICRRENGGRT